MTAAQSIQVTPSSDGILRFGDAAPAPGTDVTADNDVANETPVEGGSAFSLDLATLFSGDDEGDGTITPVILKGTLAGIGLAFAGTTISGTQVRGPAVELRARWQNDTDPLDRRSTNRFSVIVQDPLSPSGDTLEPTQVVRLSATSNGTTLTVTCDPPSDPHDGTDPGSGMDKLQYYNDVTLLAEETIAPGVSPAYTSQDIGTNAIAGTSDEDGAGGVDVSEGFFGENSGVAAFADRFRAGRIIVNSGDFIRSVRVDSFTGTGVSDNAKAALMIRAGLESDDPFWCVQVRKGLGVRVEERLVKGGSRATYGAAQGVISLPCWLRQRYIASTGVLTDEVSENGRDFTLIRERTVALPPVFYSTRASCSSTDGVQVAVAYEEDSFTTSAPIVKNITTAVTGPIKVRGVDLEGNVGPFSAEVTALSAEPEGGLFPDTNLKLYPGFVIGNIDEGSSASQLQSRWDALMTTTPNRKVLYRPPGIYAGITRRLRWWRFYKTVANASPTSRTQTTVRPDDPADHTDPRYDWSLLDAAFGISAVVDDGALIFIDIQETNGDGVPSWLSNAPYNGTYLAPNAGNERQPRYDRYSGPDYEGRTNVGASPPIVDEWVHFNRAMHDHLVATGNIDKVMRVSDGELVGGLAPEVNAQDWYRGQGLRRAQAARIWAESGIIYDALNMVDGNKKDHTWPYTDGEVDLDTEDDITLGFSMPDMKMNSASLSGITGNSRYNSPSGVYQKDIRPLTQLNQANGFRANTYFPAGSQNPWGYDNQTLPQTPMHILWALSGAPKAADPSKRDSGLGQVGEDPPGFMPVHLVGVGFQPAANPDYPTVEEWHEAIDTFGPPGTFAFPYLPPGYVP